MGLECVPDWGPDCGARQEQGPDWGTRGPAQRGTPIWHGVPDMDVVPDSRWDIRYRLIVDGIPDCG